MNTHSKSTAYWLSNGKKCIALFAISLIISLQVPAQLAPVELGRASNIYTILREAQNQVYANDNVDLVVFIHRQDTTIWVSGSADDSGILRYDISMNGGKTFDVDIGPLNPTNKFFGRYPQIVGLDPRGISNPLDEKFIYTGTTLENGDWDGMVTGVSEVSNTNPISSTEHYFFDVNDPTLNFGGLCQGISEEFWTVTASYNGFITEDSILVAQGVYDSNKEDISWSIAETIVPNHYLGLNSTPLIISPNIAFSPDGRTGWIAFLGDLIGGADSVLNPILIPTFDGGVTWGSPIEVDLRTVDFLSDSKSLSSELQDEISLVPTEGRPTCAFEFDLTVDHYGHPHLFVVIASATSTDEPVPGYTIKTEYVKLAVDLFSEDGGQSWKAFTVSPIYTFRKQLGSPTPVTMDNFLQISRNKTGDHIFYSWTDSDTSGYGTTTNNLEPNLRISSLRLVDNFITCPKWITLGDDVWDGIIYFPTMAPEVLEAYKNSGYKLPIVSAELLTSDPTSPARFWYFGNEAVITHSEYVTHYSLLNTDSCVINCANDNLTAGFDKQVEGYHVQFTDSSESVLEILTWNWQFGDGGVSGDPNPEHTFTSPGTYNVQLIVTTDCGVDLTVVPIAVPDSDGDGVPDHQDICAYGDDNKDLNSNLIPDDCECQTIDLITASTLTEDTVYIVRDEIFSSDVIQNNIYVLYKAGESITLSSGFEVNLGSTFIAAPVGCQQVVGILPKDQLQILRDDSGKTVIEIIKKPN